jgi:hypothetical protein
MTPIGAIKSEICLKQGSNEADWRPTMQKAGQQKNADLLFHIN